MSARAWHRLRSHRRSVFVVSARVGSSVDVKKSPIKVRGRDVAVIEAGVGDPVRAAPARGVARDLRAAFQGTGRGLECARCRLSR